MAKITYENKVALNENSEIADINKVKDTDMNQIKEAVNTNETKELLEVTNIAPDICSTGDMYFNTTDNLIYTATATNTWGSTGVAPTSNTIYVTFTDNTIYMYDGTTLVNVGGGAGGGGDNEPIGKVVPMALETAPDGYLLCDGSTYTKEAYPDLYKALRGTQFIVDTNSFNVPNIKGKVIVGKDSNDTDFDTIGETGGSKYLQAHSHQIKGFRNTINGTGETIPVASFRNVDDDADGAYTRTAGTGNSGNLQPYIVLNYFIKAQKLSGDVVLSEDIKIGTIFQWSGDTAPTNYMICDGSAISRTNYAELFSIIGTTYGSGDGSTTFNLPDFRGNVAVGYKSGDSDFGTLGGTGGSKYLQAHSHKQRLRQGNVGAFYGDPPFTDSSAVNVVDGGDTGVTGTGNSGNLQPYQVVNYIIKVSGTTQLSAQVVNTYNTSDSDTYSCEYINNSESYSTSEVMTNKRWIDNKPIYRKVLEVTNIGTAFSTGVSNIDELFFDNSHSFITWSSDYRYEIGRGDFNYNKTTNEIKAENAEVAIWSATITIEYTKTTD